MNYDCIYTYKGDTMIIINGKVMSGDSFGGGIQGNGKIMTQNLDSISATSLIENLSVSGALEVVLDIQDQYKGHTEVNVTAEENILPLIETRLRNGAFLLGTKEGYSTSYPPVINIKAHDLKAIETSGAVKLSGRIFSDSLTIESSGASTVELAGVVKKLQINSSGASKVKSKRVMSQSAGVISSGASSVSLWAEKKAQLQASGASSITLHGEPEVMKNKSGAASIDLKQNQPMLDSDIQAILSGTDTDSNSQDIDESEIKNEKIAKENKEVKEHMKNKDSFLQDMLQKVKNSTTEKNDSDIKSKWRDKL